jgi:hypothetical protein
MGVVQFLRKLFKFKPRFNGTPEMFLAMVMEMQLTNNKEFSLRELLQWGEVMQQVIKVDLAPYKDFPDLVQNGKPDLSAVEKLRVKIAELNHRRELKQAIYGPDVDLGDDDVMTSNSEGAVITRKIIKDLSRHVKFRDEDQDIIDQL